MDLRESTNSFPHVIHGEMPIYNSFQIYIKYNYATMLPAIHMLKVTDRPYWLIDYSLDLQQFVCPVLLCDHTDT